MTVLALDPGMRYIGVAISDPDMRVALPLKILSRTPSKKMLDDLRELVTEKNVAEIIVGRPLALRGTSIPMTREAEKLADLIKNTLAVNVTLVDERLSTRAAQRATRKRTGRAGKEGRLDPAAAAIFLQTYLDSKKSEGSHG